MKRPVVALTLIIGVIALLVLTVQRSSLQKPKGVYVCTLSADRTNLTFWASNPTPRMIMVQLRPIEVYDGTSWHAGPIWTERSRSTSQTDPTLSLSPHTAAEKQITAGALLQPLSWKLKVIEADVLVGPERYVAALRLHIGGIAITTNSFAPSSIYYGHHREIIVREALHPTH